MTWQVHCGDSRDVLTFYPDECFDSMCCDPPAGIAFMNKKWDGDHGGRDQWIEWLAGILREAYRVLKPGAHCLVWSLPRVSHWTATAVENAGFEIRDVISHIQGAGFPKSLDVGKAIDAAAGVERTESEWRDRYHDGGSRQELGSSHHEHTVQVAATANGNRVSLPATDAAKQWDGWGTAIKPSHENWVWAIKPIASKRLIAAMSAATNALEIFLWSMSPVKFARMCSGLNLARSNEAESVSVRWLAGVCLMAESQQRSEAMATFRSQEAGETLLNIAQSWSAIWGAVCRNENTYTTETEIALITVLQILKLSTSQTTPENTALAQTLKDGEWASVLSAAPNSNAELSSLIATLNTIVPEHAGRHTTDVIHCAIASIAETLTTRRQSTNVYSAGFDATDSADEQASHENWVLARKPLIGTVAANVIEHGTGGLNIDGCRVAGDMTEFVSKTGKPRSGKTTKVGETVLGMGEGFGGDAANPPNPAGRWPPNTLLSHSASCTRIGTTTIKANPAWNDNRPPSSFTGSETSPVHHSDEGKETVAQYECAADCPIAELGRQSGELHARGNTSQETTGKESTLVYGAYARQVVPSNASDSGSAARFFPNFHPDPPNFPFTEKDGKWPKQDQNQNARTVTTSRPMDTCESGATVNISSSTELSGKPSTDPCRPHTKSITETETSKTTDLKILSCLTLQHTSGCTPGVGSSAAIGKSLAGCATSSNQSTESIGTYPRRDGHSMVDVSSATAERLRRMTNGGAMPFFYSAKPSSRERDAGLDSFQTLSGGEATGRKDNTAALNSPRTGAGRGGGRKNSHATVKGSELMRWLVRLITPENGIVLDPFCGSGSTGIACVLEGFDFHGIELDPYHCDLASARIAHIDGGGWEPRTEKATAEKPKQGSLF